MPYIQLHEFETLLFCDIDAIVDEFFDLEDDRLYKRIIKDIQQYSNIELINDSIESAPSKRLDRYTDGEYCRRKTTAGVNILKRVDVDRLRGCCRHFDSWIEAIENLK